MADGGVLLNHGGCVKSDENNDYSKVGDWRGPIKFEGHFPLERGELL
jgi:hypothetical protein